MKKLIFTFLTLLFFASFSAFAQTTQEPEIITQSPEFDVLDNCTSGQTKQCVSLDDLPKPTQFVVNGKTATKPNALKLVKQKGLKSLTTITDLQTIEEKGYAESRSLVLLTTEN